MRFIISIIFCVIFSGYSYSQTRFIAVTDAKQVLVGSIFEIEFRLENAEGSNFREPDWGGIRKVSGPGRSMSTSIINGLMTSSTGYVYSAVAMKEGKYTIGPASIVTNGKTIKTNPLTITVLKSSSKSPTNQDNNEAIDGDIFIEITSNHDHVFPGQQIILTTKLYTQVGITRMERASKTSISHCDIEYIGTEFPVEREVIKGKEYLTKIIEKLIVYPISEGNLNVPSSAYRLILGDDGFGFGLKSFLYNTTKVVETNSLIIKVLPLPIPKPDNFSGAVGEFNVKFSPLSKQYSVRDAIKATLEIEGNGNFKKINPKIQIVDSLIDIMEPSTTGPLKVSDVNDLIQQQKFEFLLTPKNEGSLNINLGFCYFDPEQKKYIQVKDTNQISILKTISISQHSSQELRPITTKMKSNPLLQNQWILSGIIFLFPFIFSLFVSDYKNDSKNLFRSISDKFSSHKNQKDNIKNSISIDEQFITNIKLKFPQFKSVNNIFELKEQLKSIEPSPKIDQLNSIISEFQNAKYIPNTSTFLLQTIISKIDFIQN